MDARNHPWRAAKMARPCESSAAERCRREIALGVDGLRGQASRRRATPGSGLDVVVPCRGSNRWLEAVEVRIDVCGQGLAGRRAHGSGDAVARLQVEDPCPGGTVL